MWSDRVAARDAHGPLHVLPAPADEAASNGSASKTSRRIKQVGGEDVLLRAPGAAPPTGMQSLFSAMARCTASARVAGRLVEREAAEGHGGSSAAIRQSQRSRKSAASGSMSASRNSRWRPRASAASRLRPLARPSLAARRTKRAGTAQGAARPRRPERPAPHRRSRRRAPRSRPARPPGPAPPAAASGSSRKNGISTESRASARSQAALSMMASSRHVAIRARSRPDRLARACALSAPTSSTQRRQRIDQQRRRLPSSDELRRAAERRQAHHHGGHRPGCAAPACSASAQGSGSGLGEASERDRGDEAERRSWRSSPPSRRSGRSAGSAPGSARRWPPPGCSSRSSSRPVRRPSVKAWWV